MPCGGTRKQSAWTWSYKSFGGAAMVFLELWVSEFGLIYFLGRHAEGELLSGVCGFWATELIAHTCGAWG